MRAAWALVVLLCASASAQDVGIGKTVEDALARGDRAAALAALDAVTAPGAPRDRRKSVEAARAAMDVVGGPEGNLRAARILVDALKLDRSDREKAYSLAMELRRRTWDVDLEAGQELLGGLVRIYPEALEFNSDLAMQYRHAGLSDLARAQYEKIRTLAPSDRSCRYELALMHELRGALDDAIATYDDLIALRSDDPQPELRAHLLKTRLLLLTARDLPAARRALESGLAAAEAAPPGRERDVYVEEFRSLRADIDHAEESRRTLFDLRRKLHATLGWTTAVWLLVVGGGVVLLRRAKWI
jgi:tetratricopeptide (TPR) repeat protein